MIEHALVREMLQRLLLQTRSRGPRLVLLKPCAAVNESLAKEKNKK